MGLWERCLDLIRRRGGSPSRGDCTLGLHSLQSDVSQMGSAQLDALISGAFAPRLNALGFEQIRPRRWVRSSKLPIREIVQVQALKGASYGPRWGFSLDFVPLFRKGHFRWKRTAKSADFDLCIDPEDELDSNGRYRFAYGLPGYPPPTIAAKAALTIEHATRDFDRISSLRDVAALFEARAVRRYGRFSPENYISTHLAWGLTLLALQQGRAGEEHLALFCARFGPARDHPMLLKAVAEAQRLD